MGSNPASARLARSLIWRLLTITGVLWRFGLLPQLVPRRPRRSGPVRLRLALESLSGAWVKLGQLLSLRFDVLPEAYCVELFGLLNRVRPFPYAEVRRIVAAELGCEISDAFGSFASQPFASASIGQVHDATLPDGRRVAVKVQRPGIAELMRTDIALMRLLSGPLDRTNLLGGTRSRELVDELARWTAEELDYTVEASNAAKMRAAVRDNETEYEPEIHGDWTTSRVLTAERLDGLLVLEVLTDLRHDRDATVRRLRAAGHDVERAASRIVWNFLGQTYATGIFHGDLHPANLLLLSGDRIGYVDFGIVGEIPEQLRESLGAYAMNLFGDDASAATDELLRWLRPSRRTDVDAARAELIALTQQFLADLDDQQQRREVLAHFQVDLLGVARRHRMAIDPSMVIYLKVVLTIDAVTSELAPSLNLQALHERFFSELFLEGLQAPATEG
jgi:ubiquinone biosynthesis protein